MLSICRPYLMFVAQVVDGVQGVESEQFEQFGHVCVGGTDEELVQLKGRGQLRVQPHGIAC